MKLICLHTGIFCLVTLLSLTTQSQQKLPQLGKDPIPAVIKAMTLEEKARLVVGKGFAMPGSKPSPEDLKSPDKVIGLSGHSFAIPRLGIPSIGFSDGPAGINRFLAPKDSLSSMYSTAWPVGTLLASSWDTVLVNKVGTSFGNEIKEYGIDFILGPGLNIHRNPLGGRNFEYYSEDPLISGKMAASIINGIQSQGVGTTPKHFAVNNQETNRNTINTIVSERALREIYLKGFEILIQQSQPWAIMSSYNLVNGTYTSESYDLLTNILRNDWGFKGFVMSDWFGGKDAVGQMKSGNNLLMPGTKDQTAKIIDAVKNGQLDEKVLDENISGILQMILKTSSFKSSPYSNHPDLKQHALVSREAAAESMILLKNKDNALPLKSTVKEIALFGNHGYDVIAGGTGSGDVTKAYAISLNQGLTNAGYAIDKDLEKTYLDYLKDYSIKHPKKSAIQEIMNPTPFAPEVPLDKTAIDQIAASADYAIVYIGKNAGEGKDRTIVDDYELTKDEMEKITTVSDAFHAKQKQVIIVLNIGGVIDIVSFRDKVDAILLAWQPGMEGGNAIADVLSGRINPSGKLATTFPAAYNDVPSSKNFPGKEFLDKATPGMFGQKSIPAEVTYEEGIYVGYRYYNSFHVKPAYEFGYGMSYTNFSYTNLKLSSANFTGKLTASVTIRNSGKVAGKEVVQLYISAPISKMDKPAEELKGFAKTSLLKPGQSQTITFTITAKDLSSFNTDLSSWIADAGNYKLKIGASSEDIKLEQGFNLAKDVIVQKVNKALAPKVSINELKSK